MIVSLIGMSNCGKSYWSKKLEGEHGFTRLCCDDMIADQLSDVLPDVQIQDMDAFAAWMGMPHEFGYAEREAAYLAGEQGALQNIIESIDESKDVVIDTTGSVIYLPETLLRKLRSVSTIIYLQTTGAQVKEMTEKFFQEPKPLVWGEGFSLNEDETHEQALRRCYPELLSWRQERYEQLADMTIEYKQSHSPEFSIYDVLQHK